MASQDGWRLAGKRLMDLAITGVGAVAVAPIALATAAAIRVSMGTPVVFRQVRPGRHGRTFELVKFRTMSDARDAEGRLLPDAERLTSVGRFIRSTSLDELPQLWNVLRGDMSLVGPRPLLVQYMSRYDDRQARRHDVMPGITGWAQIRGRNALPWREKFELDVWYVENWSLGLDVRILVETLVRVVRRDDVAQDGHATMPEFMGSETGS
ncbi:MAG: sugar transferase [Myxococcota bacterium]|nr:sugar transferase [Myxococcota bacterium]